MKKSINILIFLLLLSKINYGQDTIQSIKTKNQLTIQAGIFYKIFLSCKYIQPTPFDYGDEFKDHQYERFRKVSTLGFSCGIFYIHKIRERLGITTGLVYFLRNDIFENNQDTVIKYGNGSSMRDIHNTLKYDYSYNDIVIPVMIRYSQNIFAIYFGAYFSFLTYKIAKYTYVINQYPNNPKWIKSNKTVSGFENPLMIFPTIQLSYNLRINKFDTNPYLGLYYGINKQKDLYIQFGINFPLKYNRDK